MLFCAVSSDTGSLTLSKVFELKVDAGTTVRLADFDSGTTDVESLDFNSILNGNFTFSVVTTSTSDEMSRSQAPVYVHAPATLKL